MEPHGGGGGLRWVFLAHIRPAATGTVRPSKKCTAGLECTVRAIPGSKAETTCCNCNAAKKKGFLRARAPGQVDGDRPPGMTK